MGAASKYSELHLGCCIGSSYWATGIKKNNLDVRTMLASEDQVIGRERERERERGGERERERERERGREIEPYGRLGQVEVPMIRPNVPLLKTLRPLFGGRHLGEMPLLPMTGACGRRRCPECQGPLLHTLRAHVSYTMKDTRTMLGGVLISSCVRDMIVSMVVANNIRDSLYEPGSVRRIPRPH